MHPHVELLSRFYAAFSRRDAAAMAGCYHPEVHFSDAVFDLRGPQAGLMWQMLCANGADLRVTAGAMEADERAGRAHWEARYTFGATGRPVLNRVDARFEFRDGLIVRHVDDFDFWRWSRQALGLPGAALGWTPWLRRKVQAQAARSLGRFARELQSAGATPPSPPQSA